jgi:hypothetical protein
MASPWIRHTPEAGAARAVEDSVPLSAGTELTAQAYTLLRWIGDGGLASRAQLARRFWPAARSSAVAYQYLYRLVQAGYLWPGRQTILGQVRDLYVLTPAASAALQVAPPFIRVGWPHPREYAHLLLGQQVRLALEHELRAAGQEGTIRAWRTEYLLRHLSPPAQLPSALPDIEAEVQRTATSARERLAIEIDGAYYGQLLARKAAAYGTPGTPVLWACLPRRVARLRAALAPYPNIDLFVLEPPV